MTRTAFQLFRDAGYSPTTAQRWAIRCMRFDLDPQTVLERIDARSRSDLRPGAAYPLRPHTQCFNDRDTRTKEA